MHIGFIISKNDEAFFKGDFSSPFDKYILNENQKCVIFYPNSNIVYCCGFSYFKQFQLRRLFKQHNLSIKSISQTTFPEHGLYCLSLLETKVYRYFIKLKDLEVVYFKLLSMKTEFLKLQ